MRLLVGLCIDSYGKNIVVLDTVSGELSTVRAVDGIQVGGLEWSDIGGTKIPELTRVCSFVCKARGIAYLGNILWYNGYIFMLKLERSMSVQDYYIACMDFGFDGDSLRLQLKCRYGSTWVIYDGDCLRYSSGSGVVIIGVPMSFDYFCRRMMGGI